MSKSLHNITKLSDIRDHDIEPLAYRYLLLTTHYRDKINFTWDSLQSAQIALNKIRRQLKEWDEPGMIDKRYMGQFLEAVNNDMGTPQAIAIMWNMMKSGISLPSKSATIIKMDEVFGLGLKDYIHTEDTIPEAVQVLATARNAAKKEKDFAKSDQIRDEITLLGYRVEDTKEGQKVSKIV